MKAFDIAWSSLKKQDKFSAKEIQDLAEKMKREKRSGTYDSTRGTTFIENLMGIRPLRQAYFSQHDNLLTHRGIKPKLGRFPHLLYPPLHHKNINREFLEGLENRMMPKTSNTPTRVVRRTGHGGGGDKFTLEDDEGKVYSSLSGSMVDPDDFTYSTANPTLTYLSGETTAGERRKGYYEKLLNTILQNNINIQSTTRNMQSGPFHQKFQGRLPPNIEFKEKIREDSLRSTKPRLSDGKFTYMKNPILDSKNQAIRQAQGWGDLQPDYNTVPMVNVKDTINTNLMDDLSQEHQGTEQLKLNNRGFLRSSNPENPMHDINELMFTTPKGKLYSTAHVLMDKYNPDYEDHPYYEGLGHLFG